MYVRNCISNRTYRIYSNSDIKKTLEYISNPFFVENSDSFRSDTIKERNLLRNALKDNSGDVNKILSNILIKAYKHNYIDLLQFLIKDLKFDLKNLNISELSKKRLLNNILIKSCAANRVGFVKYLLEINADINSKYEYIDEIKEFPVDSEFIIFRANDFKAIPLNPKDLNSLNVSFLYGNYYLFEFLIDNGAEAGKNIKKGLKKHLMTLDIFINYGDNSPQTLFKRNVLSSVFEKIKKIEKNRADTTRFKLLQLYNEDTTLYKNFNGFKTKKDLVNVFTEACLNDDLPLVETMIESGFVEWKDLLNNNRSFNLFRRSVLSGSLKVVKYFFENNLVPEEYISELDDSGASLLYYASYSDNFDIIEYFFTKLKNVEKNIEKNISSRISFKINDEKIFNLLKEDIFKAYKKQKFIIETQDENVFKELMKRKIDCIYLVYNNIGEDSPLCTIYYYFRKNGKNFNLALSPDKENNILQWHTFDNNLNLKKENKPDIEKTKLIQRFLNNIPENKQKFFNTRVALLAFYSLNRKENIFVSNYIQKITYDDIQTVKNKIEKDNERGIFDTVYLIKSDEYPVSYHSVITAVTTHKDNNDKIEKEIVVFNTGDELTDDKIKELSSGNYNVTIFDTVSQKIPNCVLVAILYCVNVMNSACEISKKIKNITGKTINPLILLSQLYKNNMLNANDKSNTEVSATNKHVPNIKNNKNITSIEESVDYNDYLKEVRADANDIRNNHAFLKRAYTYLNFRILTLNFEKLFLSYSNDITFENNLRVSA